MAATAVRTDVVARSFEQAPDEAYLGFSMGAILSDVGLYIIGRRDEALIVGVLGPAFALTGLMMKMLGTSRGQVH
jgi:hypothetical protein